MNLGGSTMRNYFCGWYFRCQSDRQTLAVIPSVHCAGKSQFCAIQLIFETQLFNIQFPYSDFLKQNDTIRIAGNRFERDGITLDINAPSLHATGTVRFGPFTPIKYDIMGPFRYVPFMQCRHSVFGMRHSVNGAFVVNGTPYAFWDVIGYIEGDRGYSLSSNYVWTLCSFPNGSLMLSIADIPLGGFHFTGVIGIVLLRGREYRLATYLGAKAVKIAADEIIVHQGNFALAVRPQSQCGHPLRAPISGDMTRTIHEHLSCQIFYRFEENGIPLLVLDALNAALEYEY